MPRRTFHISVVLLLLTCAAAAVRAQNDVTPLDPNFRRLPEAARRAGALDCDLGRAEAYGMSVHVIAPGRLDKYPRWVVEHILCDTAVTAKELLMYEGGADTIPDVRAATRIGPTGINSFTTFLTSADLDQDGYTDLVCAIRIIGDTSFGNRYYGVSRVVVFWGHQDGRFSVDDTSCVPANGTLWLGPSGAAELETTVDSARLMILTDNADYTRDNTIVPQPPIRVFALHRGERWGRNGVRCAPVWTMWDRPPVGVGGSMFRIDHDGDGNEDIVFYDNRGAWDSAGWVSILYGRANAYPDSNERQTVYMTAAHGRSSLLADITGDGIPELIVHCGNDEVLRIYVGIRGQRLLAQYGSGADSARPGQPEWWGRPWATLRLPRAFWTGWGSSDRHIYALGDGNGDGIDDLWVVSSSYLLCYTTGEWLDEYADGLYDVVPGSTYDGVLYPESVTHGNVLTGTRADVKLVGVTNGVWYIGADISLPHADRHVHPLPPGTGKPTTAVPGIRLLPSTLDLW